MVADCTLQLLKRRVPPAVPGEFCIVVSYWSLPRTALVLHQAPSCSKRCTSVMWWLTTPSSGSSAMCPTQCRVCSLSGAAIAECCWRLAPLYLQVWHWSFGACSAWLSLILGSAYTLSLT